MSNLPDPKEYLAVAGVAEKGGKYVSRRVSELSQQEAQVFCCILLDRITELEGDVFELAQETETKRQLTHKNSIIAFAEIALGRQPKKRVRKTTK